MDFTLCKVTFDKVDTYHRHRVFASVVLIPSHANRVQYVQISEYLIIKNCMAANSSHYYFYYHNKYLNSVKCREIRLALY
jgi:hypothetical protein